MGERPLVGWEPCDPLGTLSQALGPDSEFLLHVRGWAVHGPPWLAGLALFGGPVSQTNAGTGFMLGPDLPSSLSLAHSVSQPSGSACGSLAGPGLQGCPHHLEGSSSLMLESFYLHSDSSKATSLQGASFPSAGSSSSYLGAPMTPHPPPSHYWDIFYLVIESLNYSHVLMDTCFVLKYYSPMSCASRFLKGRS